jgi:hypothetical protein
MTDTIENIEDDWETYHNSDEIILPNISKLQEENNLKKIKEKQLVEDSDNLLTQELFSNTNTKLVKKEEQQTFQKIKPKFVKTQNKEKEQQQKEKQQKEKLNKIKKKQKDEIFGEAESKDYLQDAYCEFEDKY